MIKLLFFWYFKVLYFETILSQEFDCSASFALKYQVKLSKSFRASLITYFGASAWTIQPFSCVSFVNKIFGKIHQQEIDLQKKWFRHFNKLPYVDYDFNKSHLLFLITGSYPSNWGCQGVVQLGGGGGLQGFPGYDSIWF